MTTVTFHMEGSRITGFDAKGHSGYACGGRGHRLRRRHQRRPPGGVPRVNDVLGLAAAVKVREKDASISLRLPGGLGPTARRAPARPF